jgi:MFS family permease
MRFIFGAAEAGFAPGIILYLTYWFTANERGRWVGVFLTAIPLSFVIGGPISGFVLDTLDGSMGLGGWQWLFIIEGVPSVLVGFWALVHLTNKPIEATWLKSDERIALQARICWSMSDSFWIQTMYAFRGTTVPAAAVGIVPRDVEIHEAVVAG